MTSYIISPYHSRPVAFWSLSASEQLQGPHHQWHIRRLAGVWSGTTLRRTSVQLSKPSDATYSARPVGQPGRGRRLPQPGQLTIGEELLGYHNNKTVILSRRQPATHCCSVHSLPTSPPSASITQCIHYSSWFIVHSYCWLIKSPSCSLTNKG